MFPALVAASNLSKVCGRENGNSDDMDDLDDLDDLDDMDDLEGLDTVVRQIRASQY